MRLTDRPRTLAEIRPELNWPSAAQAVLDRALARDAKDRYPSARTFGQELVRALAEMAAPAQAPSEDRTQMIAAVPATVVNSAPAAAAATPAAPAPVAKSRTPLLVVGGGALAAVIGAAMVFMPNRAEAPLATGAPAVQETKIAQADAPTQGAIATNAGAATPAPATGAPATSAPATQPLSRTVTPNTAATPAAPASSGMTASQVDAALDRLATELDAAALVADLAQAQRAARAVGAKLDDLEAQASFAPGHDAVAELFRGEILALGDRTAEGCSKLQRVQSGGALPGRFRARLRTALDACDAYGQ